MPRTPADEAERSVIGSVLREPSRLREALEHISGDDFRDPQLGAAYDLANGFRGAGAPIDSVTLMQGLNERGYRADLDYMFGLRECVPAASSIGYYAKIVADAAGKRRLAAFGVRAQQLAEAEAPYGDLMTSVRGEWEHMTAQAGGSIESKTLGQILEGDDDYDWIIPNLLERQDRLIVTGSEGAGKSMFIQMLALLASAGIHPTTFQQIDPIKVVVVDAENSERQWRRSIRPLAIQAARNGTADPRDAMHLANVPRLNLNNEKDLASVHRLLDEHSPDLLVIGPLYRLIPKAIQSDDDAAPLITALDGLRARGCALVMEAHAGHAQNKAGDRDLRPRGSSALMGWPEFGMGLRLEAGDQNDGRTYAELVRWRGDRDQRAWPARLARGGMWPWMDAEPAMTAMTYEQQIGA